MNRFKLVLVIVLALAGLIACFDVQAETREADVVVYGDASGGVTAAVQAARMGKSVILVSQYGHLGGMTSSGLGWTDLGNPMILPGQVPKQRPRRGRPESQDRVGFNL